MAETHRNNWEQEEAPFEVAQTFEDKISPNLAPPIRETRKGILASIRNLLRPQPSAEEIAALKKAVERRAEITREEKGLPKLFETKNWNNKSLPDKEVIDPLNTPIKIGSFNIERGFKADKIIEWGKEMEKKGELPDVFCLQEVDWGCLRSGDQNIALKIAEGLGYKYVAYTTEWEEVDVNENSKDFTDEDRLILKHGTRRGKAEVGKGGGVAGQAVLSKYPIKSTTCLPLSKAWFDWEDFNNPKARKQPSLGARIAQVVKVGIGDKEVAIANTHLDIHGGEVGRLSQFDQVRDFMNDKMEGVPSIICGDLNTMNHGAASLLPRNHGDVWTDQVKKSGETAAEMWQRTEFSEEADKEVRIPNLGARGVEKEYVDPHDPKQSTHSWARRESGQLDWLLVEKDKLEILDHSLGPKGLSDHVPRLMEVKLKG